MSIILAIVHNNKVYMGGDSAASTQTTVETRKSKKVFKVGEFLIGAVGSFRLINVLKYQLRIPAFDNSDDAEEYMIRYFVPALKECLTEHKVLEIVNGLEVMQQILVGFNGRLFKIEEDFQVGELLNNFDAIGCAREGALGVVSTLLEQMSYNPEYVIGKALEYSGKNYNHVKKPFYVEII